jgi:hypothetical protein
VDVEFLDVVVGRSVHIGERIRILQQEQFSIFKKWRHFATGGHIGILAVNDDLINLLRHALQLSSGQSAGRTEFQWRQI